MEQGAAIAWKKNSVGVKPRKYQFSTKSLDSGEYEGDVGVNDGHAAYAGDCGETFGDVA